MKEYKTVQQLLDSFETEWDYKPTLFERIYYPVYRFFSNRKYGLKKLYQRLTTGFPHEQSWEFFAWHSEMVVPRLKCLRANLNGHPGNITMEQWEDILDQIIWSFENCDNGPDMNDYKDLTPKDYFEKCREHKTRVQTGLDLFAEYYLGLWD